jgi:hypothetical protein
MDWSNQLDNITRIPITVDETVTQLIFVLDNEHKQFIATMPESDLINLHFSLGIKIRNAFGLHNQDSPLLKSLGYFVHPDDVSMVIINALWKKLNQE